MSLCSMLSPKNKLTVLRITMKFFVANHYKNIIDKIFKIIQIQGLLGCFRKSNSNHFEPDIQIL